MVNPFLNGAKCALIAAFFASAAASAWAAPQVRPLHNADGARIAQVRGDREHDWAASGQNRLEPRYRQTHTGGGGNSK